MIEDDEDDEAAAWAFELGNAAKDLLADPHLTTEQKAGIQRAFEIFLVSLEREPEVAIQALNFGAVLGVYIFAPDVLPELERLWERLKQSSRGKASGAARKVRSWREHAAELAKVIYDENPSAAQDEIASAIKAGWGLAEPKCKKHSTLKTFISELLKSGELPKKQKKQK
jgi:hypothetical protein